MARPRTIEDETLLQIARGVFQAQGHTATTRDVARAAGISQAVLYQRFRSKDELFFAAMMPSPPDVDELLGDESEGRTNTQEHLVNIARRLTAYFAVSIPSVLHLATHPTFSSAMTQAHQSFEPLVEALAHRLATLQKQKTVGSINSHASAEAFIAAFHSLAFMNALADHEAAPVSEAHLRACVDVFWRGFAPEPARRAE